MAGKEAAKAEAPASEAAAAPKSGKSMKAIIVAVAIVALEGATVGVTMMMAGGPKRVVADTPATAPAEVHEKDAEVKLVEAKLPNAKHGPNRLYLYDLSVVAKVSEKEKEKAKGLFEERDAEIKDRIRTIIASSLPEALAEPGLETLRRQIKYQLEHDIGKDIIKELLIPKCTPMRMD